MSFGWDSNGGFGPGQNDDLYINRVFPGGYENLGDSDDFGLTSLDYFYPSYHDDYAGLDIASAYSIDGTNQWTTFEFALVEDDTVPHLTIVQVPLAGEQTYWWKVTVGAGQTITIDIDTWQSQPLDASLSLYGPDQGLIDTSTGSDITDGGEGSRFTNDPYISYLAAQGGTYYFALSSPPEGFTSENNGNAFMINVSVTGHAISNLVYGQEGAVMRGGTGADLLIGGAGQQQLSAGNTSLGLGDGEADRLVGGTGGDQYRDIEAFDRVVEYTYAGDLGFGNAVNSGWDYVYLAGNFFDGRLNPHIEYVAAANYAGSTTIYGDDYGTYILGSSFDDYLVGGASTDWLLGGAGRDILIGGLGDDRIIGDEQDIASYATAEGAISISLAISGYQDTGSAGMDDLRSVDNLLGTPYDDVLIGNANGNNLEGGEGDDYLNGSGGLDAASYEFAAAGVEVTLQIQGVAQDTLGAGFDTLVDMEGVIGSDFNDLLYGDDNNNRFEGLEGADIIYGYAGIDRIDGGRGSDRLYGGMGSDRMWGGQGNDRLYGDEGKDRLFGDNGDDKLWGGDGNDRMNGGIGADDMIGGLGDDVYFVDDAGDVVTELFGEGKDTVVAGVNFTLGDHFENLRMREGDLTGVGNSDDNLIRGVGGANLLRGLSGDDDLYGGTGGDTLIGGGGSDRLIGEKGVDTLTGGSGKDYFIFNDAAELGDRVAIADLITDFSQAQGDLINVRGIDASLNELGDQNFTFIGTDAFNFQAGELRFFQNNASTVIEMDLDGNGVADIYIKLEGVIDLTAADFVL